MALEGMHDEMIRQLQNRSPSQSQIAEYETLWNHAISQSREPLPCPLCFLSGEVGRLKSLSDEGGIGIAKCERCREAYEYQAP
ncbi:MAG: hypothetical protein ACKVQT_20495, partial [Burkholderiales bacterium]